jgi:CheY-like chemotaxis protein
MDEPMKSHQEERAAARRVLVVDDSVDATRMMELVLEPEGFEVRSVHDGPEAIEAARSQLPDVVLLDVGLPTMGGVEVAMELASPRGWRTPSSSPSRATATRCSPTRRRSTII